MNTCGTCKHFGELITRYLDRESEHGDDEPNTKFHQCLLLTHLNESRYTPLNAPPLPNVAAGVIDGSGYHAVFCVSEEFGCN